MKRIHCIKKDEIRQSSNRQVQEVKSGKEKKKIKKNQDFQLNLSTTDAFDSQSDSLSRLRSIELVLWIKDKGLFQNLSSPRHRETRGILPTESELGLK